MSPIPTTGPALRVHHSSMRHALRRGAPGGRGWWVLGALGPALLLLTGAAALLTHQRFNLDSSVLEDVYPNIVFGSLVPLLGALVLSRVPRHPVGLLFIATGLASALTMVVYAYARTQLMTHPLPGTIAAAWVSEWIWTMGLMPLVTLGVLLFPDGRVDGRWRRVVLGVDLAMVGLNLVAHALRPGRLTNHPFFDNPLGVPLPRVLFDVLGSVAMGCFVLGFFGGVVSAVVRWRRAEGAERAQLRWFAFAAALLAVVGLTPTSPVGVPLTVLAIPLLPVSVAVAILRHRLYGVEVVVRRSLAYAALTTVLLLVYALVVTGLGALLDGRASTAVAVVATGLVAVAFAPLRDRLQSAVDRLLYGDRHDPYAVLSGLGRRLGTAEAAPLEEAVATIASSLRLPYVRVEVDGDVPLVAETGASPARADDLHVVALTFRGEAVGRLVAAPRGARDRFSSAEQRLLDDLGGQLGVTAHATRLAAALQRSREGLVTAREEERRRIRRDLHDGLGPALAGVALGLDAVARLSGDEPDRAARLAAELKVEVQQSLADVRRLVEDLRPPALDQLGLVGAVRQQARRLAERDPSLEVAVESVGVVELPAAVEVAAYRIATEALRNVSQHAAARHCRVCLSLNGSGVLRLDVEDDGVGLAADRRIGVGLTAMHERAAELGGSCRTAAGASGGTRVAALLPVGPVVVPS
jgi:signal transduction histidine kinase